MAGGRKLLLGSVGAFDCLRIELDGAQAAELANLLTHRGDPQACADASPAPPPDGGAATNAAER